MTVKHLLPALAVSLTVLQSSQAVDLAQFRLHAPVEPAYESDSQHYCLLVFGATAEFQSWIVRDGQRYFVDRNGNGSLTDPGEEVLIERSSYCDLGRIETSKSADRFSNLRIYPHKDGTYRLRSQMNGQGAQMVGFGKAIRPSFGRTIETAPVIHFDGPMTLGQYGEQQTIPRDTDNHSYRVTSLKLMVGTPGVGRGAFAAYHCKCRRDKTLSGTAEFPSSEKRPLIARLDYQMKG